MLEGWVLMVLMEEGCKMMGVMGKGWEVMEEGWEPVVMIESYEVMVMAMGEGWVVVADVSEAGWEVMVHQQRWPAG